MLEKRTFPLRYSSQLTGVPEHVVQRYVSLDSELVLSHFVRDDRTPSRVQGSNDVICDTYRQQVLGQLSLNETDFGTQQARRPQHSSRARELQLPPSYTLL